MSIFLPESPRLMLGKKRFEAAYQSFKVIAQANRKELKRDAQTFGNVETADDSSEKLTVKTVESSPNFTAQRKTLLESRSTDVKQITSSNSSPKPAMTPEE